ncbi:hypothetical protein HHK36_013109 [Tetracentron sinense]|uniref:5-amino-6-(5-phosphoribosylamino)uracil reductase n=1 Tax=Tetracentron sinense TaxID=13715 RepID=A0A834ZGH3_TETSI|nr:hypothetical protein HHK36_013109 [Tetracentron sinense]
MVFSLGVLSAPIVCRSDHSLEAGHIRRAAEIADKSTGFTSPHPNFGCVIAMGGNVIGEGYLYAQGTKCAELQAVEAGRDMCKGASAYINMEPGDCHGDQTAVSALVKAGISRVVVGIRNPLPHLRGNAIRSLRSGGVQVDVLGEDLQSKMIEEALKSCVLVNAPLLYRAASRVPFSVLKFAMTLDGKIAASSGHASWISSKQSRNRVFELRGRSDAIIVGGNTVRRDDPRLTARHGGGHVPMRIVMSQTLNLPEVANLWDVSDVRTIVATQRGARKSFQKLLASKGVEVVEFDILNPRDVMGYLYDRGCLSILWECGGTLAAPAISSGIIHQVFAFVAPKIIGGENAPSPVGELGMVEMTQALDLIDVSYEQIGPDMLISGFLHPIPDLNPIIPSVNETSAIDPTVAPYEANIIFFYKTWDPYGAMSNFSPHLLRMPDENGGYVTWPSVEHYYQAHKFVGVNDPLAKDYVEQIKSTKSPEEAARLGRTRQRQRPDLVCLSELMIGLKMHISILEGKMVIEDYTTSPLLTYWASRPSCAKAHDPFGGISRLLKNLNCINESLSLLLHSIMRNVKYSAELKSICY